MKKPTSLKRHLFLTKNFILMLVMLVLIIVAISAWFSFHKTVTADNITVKAVSSEVNIANVLPGGEPGEEGPGEFSDKITFTGTYKFSKDCTGDGENLIVPEFNVTKDFEVVRKTTGKEVNENQPGKTAKEYHQATEEDPEFHYYQFQFFIRSKSPDVYLDESSVLLSGTEEDGNNLFSSNPSTKSDYGNNPDGLVGAMRVSLIAQACNSANQTWENGTNGKVIQSASASPNAAERQLLWDPRPDVNLSIPDEPKNITDWSLTQITNFTGYAPFYYKNNANGTGLDKIIDEDDEKLKVSNQMGTCTAGGRTHNVPYLNGSVQISTFTGTNGYNYNTQGAENGNGLVSLAPDSNHTSSADLEQYYVTKYTMNVWIEGTDHEARRAMDGGKFSMILHFR